MDQDDDGIAVVANSLALRGGTIRSTDDSTNATLTHAAQSAANHRVDTELALISNMEQARTARPCASTRERPSVSRSVSGTAV